MAEYIIEACVESLEEAESAVNKGAHRIELCSDLDNGGLTPEKKLIFECLRVLKIPVKVMIRPRSGNFQYNHEDIHEIKRNLMICQNLGVDHIVFGANKNNRLDIELIRDVAQWASPMSITIHKAIDVSHDPLNDIEALKSIRNVNAILSSGQKATALEGSYMLNEMLKICDKRFELIPAGKITVQNLKEVSNNVKAKAFHGRKIV